MTSVLLTGASGGLGTVISDSLNQTYSFVLVESNSISNKNINSIKLDLTKKSDIDSLLQIPFDHIVLCHAVMIEKEFDKLSISDMNESLSVNLMSNLLISQLALNKWMNHRNNTNDHSITYISTVATKTASEKEVAYHTSKRAMEGVILSIARGYAKDNIRANVISPGIMNVGMGAQTLKSRPDVLSRIPLNRAVDPKDIANAVDFLIKSKSITGQNIHVNCGRYFSI